MSVPGAVGADEELIHVREVLADVAVRVGADRIELFTGGAGIHGEYRVSFEAVSIPAQPDAIDMVDAVDVVERVRHLIHEFGFYAVEQAAADATDGADEEDEYRGGDDQPDDRVSQREAEQDSDSTSNDGEGGEAVGAGVDAVRDQRGDPMRCPTRIRYTATISLPRNPMIPAAITQPMLVSGCGWRKRSTDCQAATTARQRTR